MNYLNYCNKLTLIFLNRHQNNITKKRFTMSFRTNKYKGFLEFFKVTESISLLSFFIQKDTRGRKVKTKRYSIDSSLKQFLPSQ